MKQYQGETLKEYISRFGAQVVKVGTTEEPMIVYAFRKGVCPGPFCESIIRNREERLGEEAPLRGKEAQPRGRAEGNRPAREGNRPLRHNFVVELKDLIIVPNIVDRLKPPVKSDKVLGPYKESWCEFHEAFRHHINNCLALGYQLDELVKNGFLKDYPAGSAVTTALTVPDEMSIHGEVHTISSGFSGGGLAASQRKRYEMSVSLGAEEFSMTHGSQTSSHMTMTPWSFRSSQLEERYIGFSSTRAILLMSCFDRPSTSYSCPLT